MDKGHNHSAFSRLPTEILILILDQISNQKHRGWAQCAAVCKEWQAILEPKNFSQLTLQPSCLDELETLVIRQRPFVQHICLHFELPRYSCDTCNGRYCTMIPRGLPIFSEAMLKLFSILNTWQPAGQLTLELSASSPSDSQHWFKNYCFGPGHADTRQWTQEEKAMNWHDPTHGWIDGQQVVTPDLTAIGSLVMPFFVDIPRNLPTVHAVTHFCIRRQVRRQIFPHVLQALWDKLPRLESIVHEVWRVPPYHWEVTRAYGTFNLVPTFVVRF